MTQIRKKNRIYKTLTRKYKKVYSQQITFIIFMYKYKKTTLI